MVLPTPNLMQSPAAHGNVNEIQPQIAPNTVLNPITTIVIALIETAQQQGRATFQTHKKDASLFAGRKIHSYTLPNGSCHLFIKQKSTVDVAPKTGTYKNMLPSDHYVWDSSTKTLQRLNDVARLRFYSQDPIAHSNSAREIELLQKLQGHKNIIELIAHGTYVKQTPKGAISKTVLYEKLYDMDLVEFAKSENFQKMVSSQRCNVILSIAEQMLHAAHHAHTNDIIVNDFKPANMLLKLQELTPLDIALTDFGLSQLSAEMNSTPNLCTAELLSPETCLRFGLLPKNETNDPNGAFYIQAALEKSIDIWALGITLYYLENKQPHRPMLLTCFLRDTYNLDCKYHELIYNYKLATQSTNTTPAPDTEITARKVEIQNIIAHSKIMLDKLETITAVSNPLEPSYENAPDYALFTTAHQWQKDCTTLFNALITIYQNYPAAVRQENMNAVIGQVVGITRSYTAVSQKMLREYFKALEQLPIPPADQNPIQHLIHRMLQPNAAKRITVSGALQMIQEYRDNQTSSTPQNSGRKRDHSTQD